MQYIKIFIPRVIQLEFVIMCRLVSILSSSVYFVPFRCDTCGKVLMQTACYKPISAKFTFNACNEEVDIGILVYAYTYMNNLIFIQMVEQPIGNCEY